MFRYCSARYRSGKLRSFLRWTVALVLLALMIGCWPASSLRTASPSPDASLQAQPASYKLDKTQKPNPGTPCPPADPFGESVRFALQAANLAQTANTKEDWDEVAGLWVQAVAWMQAVPVSSPRRAFAEKKVVEYMRNLAYSQQQASTLRSNVNPTFSSELLDQQLQLYLSYVATVGPPDILIVGSSRALQGVDPAQLKQSLAARGRQGLTIFNFGVNGATAQVIDFQLRKLLKPDQLPRMIVWADGARAFNSGRVDRTYNSIIASEGNQLLGAGVRPSLSAIEPAVPRCYSFPGSCSALVPQAVPLPAESLQPTTLAVSYPATEALAQAQPVIARVEADDLASAITANGFLSLSERFNPATYYQQRPYVAGRYDGDYADFNLEGRQATALNAIANFAKTRKIPLVFVNLPLTEDYLDGFRWNAEQRFQQRMQRLSRQKGFIFRDLSQRWLNRNDFFADPSHLNRFGAQAVSRQLAADTTIPWPRARQRRFEG